jgi:hypothetical protein
MNYVIGAEKGVAEDPKLRFRVRILHKSQ